LPVQFGAPPAAAGSQLTSVTSQKQKLNVFNPATLMRPGPRPTSLTTPASGLPGDDAPLSERRGRLEYLRQRGLAEPAEYVTGEHLAPQQRDVLVLGLWRGGRADDQRESRQP